MNVQTTYSKPKPFSWSWSKIKNFNTCPRRYYEIDVAKRVKEEESETLAWGNSVHDALHKYVAKGTPLPKAMVQFQDIADKVKNAKGTVIVEQKFALTEELEPCDFFDKKAWFRGIADALVVNGRVALAIDYKLGKVLEDSQQLSLLAACVLAHHPEVEKVRTEYWWLKDDAVSRAHFSRESLPEIWNNVMPHVKQLKEAHETMTFPPKQSGLCKRFCPVVSCPHHGG